LRHLFRLPIDIGRTRPVRGVIAVVVLACACVWTLCRFVQRVRRPHLYDGADRARWRQTGGTPPVRIGRRHCVETGRKLGDSTLSQRVFHSRRFLNCKRPKLGGVARMRIYVARRTDPDASAAVSAGVLCTGISFRPAADVSADATHVRQFPSMPIEKSASREFI
jgi:hypothetical protein